MIIWAKVRLDPKVKLKKMIDPKKRTLVLIKVEIHKGQGVGGSPNQIGCTHAQIYIAKGVDNVPLPTRMGSNPFFQNLSSNMDLTGKVHNQSKPIPFS